MSIEGFIINGNVVKYDYDELDNLPSGGGSGLTDEIKEALLQLASKVAYIDANGQDYYDDLYDALYTETPATLVSISAVYTQSGTVYDTDSLDSLKSDLVVTAYYDDSSSHAVSGYTLSGTLTVGTSTITVSYGGKTDTFTVIVSQPAYLKNGTFDTSNGQYRFTITNGKHIKVEVLRAGSSTTTNFIMLNCCTGDYSVSDSSSINNKAAVFTLPANELVTLKAKNVVNSNNGGSQLIQFIVVLRNALGTTSYLATSETQHTSDVTVSSTPPSDTGIGAVGFGVNGKIYAQGAYAEFDLEVTSGSTTIIG